MNNGRFTRTAALLLITASVSAATRPADPRPGVAPQARAAFARMPLRFEPNVGQASPDVRFVARGGGYTMLLGSRKAVMVLPEASNLPSSAVTMTLTGAAAHAPIHAETPLPSVSNYYIGDDANLWRHGVPNYDRVHFAQVYPGIDLVYYGNQNQFEFDFVVEPAADPTQIRFSYSGADAVAAEPSGDLTVKVRGRELRFRRPLIYQELAGKRRRVDGAYEVNAENREVRFRLAKYDHKRALVIDPAVVYATYLGGSADDQAFGVAVDSSHNAYITGQTAGSFPIVGNPAQSTFGGGIDAFVSKFNASGTLVYSTYLGGSQNDTGLGIAADSSGAAYVTGEARLGFPTLNAAQGTFGGTGDAFVAKLNSTGGLVYSTFLGGADYDEGLGIAVDSTGAAYVNGETAGAFPTVNAYQASYGGGTSDMFLTKLNPSGVVVYSTYLGGPADDFPSGIGLDASGNVYIAGETTGSGFPVLNAFQSTYGGGNFDAIIAKFNSSGSLVYSTYLGGSADDGAWSLAADSAGSVYVTGYTDGSFRLQNAYQSSYGGGTYDAFVTKLGPSGTLVYSTYLGGPNYDFGTGIAIDNTGAAYVSGLTAGSFPVLNAEQSAYGGGNYDAFVAELNPSGAVLYASYLGGSGDDYAGGFLGGTTPGPNSIAVDSTGAVYVAGGTTGNFPVTSAYQFNFGGGAHDAFLAKIGPFGTPATSQINSIAPDTAPVGASPFNIYVFGTGFSSNATVLWNGIALTTSTNTSNGLIASVPSNLVSSAGVASITVMNSGQNQSNAAIFTVTSTPPTPAITQASENYYFDSNGNINLYEVTVAGSKVETAAVVSWNGVNLTTSPGFGSVGTNVLTTAGLNAIVPANLVQTPGPVTITVTNPGGTPSNGISLTVPALRHINNLSPNSVNIAAGNFTLTVNGSGFVNGDLIWVEPNVGRLTTTFVNSGQLQATIPAGASESAATYQVWVETSASGAGPGSYAFYASNEVTLTVGAIPQLTSLVPNSATAGSAGFTLTVNGSGFVSGASVQWNGANLTTSFVNGSQLTATVPASLIASPATASITVTEGSITSSSLPFSIVSSCSYSLQTSSVTVANSTVSGSVNITANCPFTVVSNNPDWITITGGASGNGSGAISYTVAANTGPARSGSFNVLNSSNDAVAIYTINQNAANTLSISPTAITFSASGGTGTATFNVSPGSWTLTSNASWLHAPASGSASSFNFTVDPNPSANARTGTLTIPANGGSLTITVTENGNPCTYTLATYNGATSTTDPSTSASFLSGGGSGNISVIASPSGCVGSWTVTSNAAFITVPPGTSGTGSAIFGYGVAQNSGSNAPSGDIIVNATSGGATYSLNYAITQASHATQSYSGIVNAIPTTLRREGIAELTGDILVSVSGTAVTGGVTGDVIVTLNRSITSRALSIDASGQTTEALLLLNEPSPQNIVLGTNAFRGVVAGQNTIRFLNVPLAPSSGGTFGNTLRITNIRTDATQTSAPSTVYANVTVVAPVPFNISNPVVTVAFVRPSGSSSFGYSALTSGPGGNQNILPIQFSEAFANAFRPRLAANQDPSQAGTIYASESGFVNSAKLGTQIGFATNGTRLVAHFPLPSNLASAGVTLYAPLGPASGTNAELVSADSSGAGGFPVQSKIVFGGVLYQQIIPDNNGIATATWEVTAIDNGNPATLTFNVLISNPNNANLAAIIPTGSLGPQALVTAPSITAASPRFLGLLQPIAGVSVSVAPGAVSTGLLGHARNPTNPQHTTRLNPRYVAVGGTVPITSVITGAVTSSATQGTTVGGSVPLTAQIADCAATGGGACQFTPGGNTFSVNYNSFYPGESETVTVLAYVPNGWNGCMPYRSQVVTTQSANVSPYSVYTQCYAPNPGASLSISSSHNGNFTAGQKNAAYTITVSNQAGAGPALGSAVVNEVLPTGLTLVSMSGQGWTCPQGKNTCTYNGGLNAGASLPPITVLVNVASNAPAQLSNRAALTGPITGFAGEIDSLADVTNVQTAAISTPLGFFPITPCRIVDTRAGHNTSGQFGPPLLANLQTRDIDLWNSCGLPASANAFSLNFTVVPPGGLLFLTVWPTGQSQPNVSTLNAPDGSTLANAAIVPAGANGSISVFAGGGNTDLIIDANGYFGAPAGNFLEFYPLTPCRIADTRPGHGTSGAFGPPGLANGPTRDFPIRSACSIPPQAQAYSLNFTVVPQGQLQYLSVWPKGQAYPGVSTLNSNDGTTLANAAIVPAGTDAAGSITTLSGGNTDLIIDINGYFAAPAVSGLHFYTITPCRVADTRQGQGFSGAFGPPAMAANSQRNFPIQSSNCNIPATAQVYALNVTAVPQGPLQYLSIWPAGQPYPNVSTLNSPKGTIIANAAIVPAGSPNGGITILVGGTTDVILDINGYFAP